MQNLFEPKMNKQEQLRLVKQAKQGDTSAKDRLVMSCSGLITKSIQQFASKNAWCYPHINQIYDDLFSSGLLGITYAFEKFDVSKNTSFSSYALYWIKEFLKKEFSAVHKSISQIEISEDNIADETVIDTVFRKLLAHQLLQTISAFERNVVMLYFGIGCKRRTLKQIAKKYGCSFQYIEKVKQRALQKMRNNCEYALSCA